jgi:hypothetical protein
MFCDPGISKTERAAIDVLKMIHIMTTMLFLMGFTRCQEEGKGATGFEARPA